MAARPQPLFDALPPGYVFNAKLDRMVPTRPRPGEMYDLLFAACGGELRWVRDPRQQPVTGWGYKGVTINVDTAYLELSCRGYEIGKTIARDVLWRLMANCAVEDGPTPAQILERSLALSP